MPLSHVLLLQKERREKKAHDRVLSAVEQHSLGEALLDDRACRDFQIDALNEAAPTYFFRGCVLIHQLLQLMVQVGTYPGDIFQQLLFFDNRKVFEGYTAGKRAAAEGGAVLSG